MPVAEHVTEQERRNQEATKKQQAEIERKQKIRAAAAQLRQQGKELHKQNKAIRDKMKEYKEACGSDLLQLRAENESLAAEGVELRQSLALLKQTAGV